MRKTIYNMIYRMENLFALANAFASSGLDFARNDVVVVFR